MRRTSCVHLACLASSFLYTACLRLQLVAAETQQKQARTDTRATTLKIGRGQFPHFVGKDKSESTMRECGEGHNGLLSMAIDNTDPDAKVLVHAQLSQNKLTLLTGSTVEKAFTLKDVIIPMETVDDSCFSIRNKAEFATILCARNLHSRNEWINYLHESVLCEETGVKGKLPAEPGQEFEEEEATMQMMPVEEPSGINIHLSDSPFGKPQILVNGVTVQEMEGIQRAQAVRDVFPSPPSPSIHEFPNPAASMNPRDPDTPDTEGEPKTAESIEAMHEAEAEQGLFDLADPRVPDAGYAKKNLD